MGPIQGATFGSSGVIKVGDEFRGESDKSRIWRVTYCYPGGKLDLFNKDKAITWMTRHSTVRANLIRVVR